MPLDFTDCQFQGPALPDPFVKFELEKELKRNKLLRKTTGKEGKELKQFWDGYRRKLRSLAASGGAMRVRNHVIEPLTELLGYSCIEAAADVKTREDRESGGVLLVSEDGESKVRLWVTSFNEDLFAPSKRGRAYRFSHLRIAQRVLLASGERFGLLTNGIQLMLLISDPARPDSTVTIPIDPGWRRGRDVPDSFLLLLAMASPAGVKALPDLVDKARLQQARVTKELRLQARQAVERFIQEVIDHPANREWFQSHEDHDQLAKDLWHEGLVTVYRLLFILKLESSDNPAQSFTFASTSLWRNTFSPSIGLAGFAREVLEHGAETGSLLEQGLRNLFKMFDEGLECTELMVKPLGGALFGLNTTPHLAKVKWGERAVAHLLDRLLWTPLRRGADTRERVHYGPLDVEDLGRVYEALLELEPGISGEPMCRLRRSKLEVVVPLAQGEKYRPTDDEEASSGGTSVEWIERIEPGQFYLRVGLGRKASGSYYTPHSFVRFLVQETLGPQVEERSPQKDPNPLEILKLKVLDPAMGSGHFLVEACRYLGHHLYEACRLCDENATAAERRAERGKKAEREAALEEAAMWRQRVIALPDPDDEMLKYLPSRSPEGEETGYSQQRAEALCRRLVSTHCLYGVDKNPLAVELAKLALWLESHAEGMPLTFLDHRLVLGDSLTGPFWLQLTKKPSNPLETLEGLFSQGLNVRFQNALADAIRFVSRLDASVGASVSETLEKQSLKAELDRALLPFRLIAAAWTGGVMIGAEKCDDGAYMQLLEAIANGGALPKRIESEPLRRMIARALECDDIPVPIDDVLSQLSEAVAPLPYDLVFPEVYFPTGVPFARRGFDIVLGNPPWNKANLEMPEYMASFDFQFAEASGDERDELVKRYEGTPAWTRWLHSVELEDGLERVSTFLHPCSHSEDGGFGSGHSDIFAPFVDSMTNWLRKGGVLGMVLPSALHVSKSLAKLRRKLLSDVTIKSYFCFENKRDLFEIHNSWKFTPVVVVNAQPPKKYCFPAQFYLHHDEWLHADKRQPAEFVYDTSTIIDMDPDTLIFQEFTTPQAAACCKNIYKHSVAWKQFAISDDWKIRRELNATDDRWRVIEDQHPRSYFGTSPPAFVHHKPGTIHQYTDEWEGSETTAVPIANLLDKPRVLRLGRFYRAAYRMTARATDQRTSIYALLPPGATATNTVPIEGSPEKRANAITLGAIAVCNSFSFDWGLRLKVGSKTVSKFIMETTRIPKRAIFDRLCCHGALRLSANRHDFAGLWEEQLGDAWRESGRANFTWPVLAGDDERWALRALIDAVVADAYGLSRDHYEYVLSTFSHSSYPSAPELCLAAFDELKDIGLEAFTKKHDPYHDIPLNENLPEPVINLPIPGEEEDTGDFKLTDKPKKSRAARK